MDANVQDSRAASYSVRSAIEAVDHIADMMDGMASSIALWAGAPDADAVVEIPLTQDRVARVSPCDADLLDANWYAKLDRSGICYAVRNAPRPEKGAIRMHRVVLARKLGRELLPTEEVDHIDGDGLNNVRGNLRLATHAQNMRNSRKRSFGVSPYKGIYFHRQNQRWRAEIKADGKRYHLGCFDTPEEAYAAYCEAATKLHGKFARFD